MTKRSKQ